VPRSEDHQPWCDHKIRIARQSVLLHELSGFKLTQVFLLFLIKGRRCLSHGSPFLPLRFGP
jgi:uncharacterized membrane protein affecting hemolysin expression